MKHSIAVLCSTLLLAAATDAAAQEMLVGGKIGGNFNQLSQPSDPAGEPTVLFGTAFTGFGFQAGATLYRELTRLGIGPLFVDTDVLIAHQRASGFAESRTSDARRTVTIHTTGIRVPALLGAGFRGTGSMFSLAVGPELLLGIAAGSSTTQEGDAGAGSILPVRPVTHVGLTGQLGMLFQLAGGHMPIDLRFTWDPMVKPSSRERFDGYVDFDTPGEYQVAFNWQAVVMVGWLFDVSGEPKPETVPPTPSAPPGKPEPVEPEEPEDIDLG